ncbi:MAG: hypothetical protein E2O68_00545 [Deltaproteobacteria bacterium]|nr:MAG: hypothetical protein E2O68_00545 [Deltaproteobacteria bacterium]
MKWFIIFGLLCCSNAFAKRDAGNSIRKVCRPTLAQCEKDRMSLAVLNAKYNDIYFDLNNCKSSAGRYCFNGRLNILYDFKPTQNIDMIVDEDTCNTVARTANDTSGRFASCNLKCRFFTKKRGGYGKVLLVLLFNTKRLSKPYNLKGQCRIKK